MIESLVVCVPKTKVDRSFVDTDQLRSFERVTGIMNTRRFLGTTAEMIYEAYKKTTLPKNINNIIVVTQSPDRLSPCMAMDVHRMMGLGPKVLAFDVNHACDGWVVGLHICGKLDGKSLLVCADRLRYDKTPTDSLIFSDSVSFTVMSGMRGRFQSFTDSGYIDDLYCGFKSMHMNGDAIFDYVTTKIPTMIQMFGDNADWLVPHQANLSMNKLLEIRSGFRGRCAYSVQEYGNQSLNGIPTAIAMNEDSLMGKDILLCGFGAGLTTSMMQISWPSWHTSQIVEF